MRAALRRLVFLKLSLEEVYLGCRWGPLSFISHYLLDGALVEATLILLLTCKHRSVWLYLC